MTLDSRIRQFINSSQREIAEVGTMLSNGQLGGLSALAERLSVKPAVAGIASFINSSKQNTREFIERLESSFEPQALKFVFGGVLAGVGGGMLAEAVGLAALLGVSVLTVELVAIALLLYGVALALPAIWKLATDKLKQTHENLGFE